jgi:hypothetical protein
VTSFFFIEDLLRAERAGSDPLQYTLEVVHLGLSHGAGSGRRGSASASAAPERGACHLPPTISLTPILARTRRNESCEESVLRDVLLVRGRLPLGGREVEAG